jgi:hypothetical protein
VSETKEIWYSISAMKRAAVKVRVIWNGREFDATITRNAAGNLQWATILPTGEIKWLPPAREARQWGDQPDAWRPLGPWPDPLPTPMITAQPRVWSSRMRFQLVEEASAADLAREMEHDRESARVHRGAGDFDPKSQWWKDPYAIKYQPAGEITKEMAEGRLMRAVAACGARAGLTLESRTAGTVLADLATAADEAFRQFDATSDGAVQFRPLPQDHADFCEAMRWFAMLNPPKSWARSREAWTFNRMQKTLLFRAFAVPLNWREIGNRIKRTDQRARQLYAEAIVMAAKIANAPDRSTAEFEALRERNRAFKRGAGVDYGMDMKTARTLADRLRMEEAE